MFGSIQFLFLLFTTMIIGIVLSTWSNGGEASDDVYGLLKQKESAMNTGSNVKGVLMGRNLLYPPGDDPLPPRRWPSTRWSMKG